jgi:phenylalanyl-tRNA synthetase beta chain
MKISYQWLCELLATKKLSVESVASALTDAGLEIEKVHSVGENLGSVVVAVVKSTRAHPTSKNPLSLVTVDLGGGHELEVVCGAPNVPAAGGRVLFAPVGTTVSSGDGKSFTLVEKPVAGIVSKGMLCSEIELDLGSDGDGIIVIDDIVAAGTKLVDYLPGARDWILEVNVTPNRPDALGHVGVARDVAALMKLPFAGVRPKAITHLIARDDMRVRVESHTPACDRFEAAVMIDAVVKRSPLWLRSRLWRLGLRAINNVVDASNYVMLELGQPNHTYDFDAIAERSIVARNAKDGEALQTLDGKHRTLSSADVVIADPVKALGLAGVMGGEGSGINDKTTRLLLEAAHFDASTVRKMSKRHDIHSDASHRFERGVDPNCPALAIARLKELLCELTGAIPVQADVSAKGPAPVAAAVEVTVRDERVAKVLGLRIERDESVRILKALGFEVLAQDAGTVTVRVASWRPDVTREIDVIEELGRVHGLDRVPLAVVPNSGARAGVTRDFSLRRRTREAFVALGVDEAVNYAFDSDELFALVGAKATAHIANPLSAERAAMRPTLVAGLLKNASLAARHGERVIRLFEVGTVFTERNTDDPHAEESSATRANEGPVDEQTRVAFVLVGPRDAWLADAGSVDVLDGKGLIESLMESLFRTTITADRGGEAPPWAHRASHARICAGETVLGYVAELHPSLRAPLKLPAGTVVADLSLAAMASTQRALRALKPSKLPSMRRDVALLVARSHPIGAIGERLRSAAGERCASVELFDRYVGKGLPDGTHSIAFALTFAPLEDKSLTDADVDGWVKSAVSAVVADFGASQR